MNPFSQLSWLTKKIFTDFVLPAGLRSGDWTPGDEGSRTWIKNLVADIQIVRTIRMVLRDENAKSLLLEGSAKFFFEDN